MVEEEITSIFHEVITNNLRYCAICLRTERERKLVEPISYRKCLGIFGLRWAEHQKESMCYICEGQAQRAVQVFNALTFAATISRWFKLMATKLRYVDAMPGDLKRFTEKHLYDDCSLPVFWRKLRARTELLQTEILTVTTEGIQEDGDVDTIELATPSPPPTVETESHILSDMLSDPELEQIVIVDDDDETHTNTEVDLSTHTQTNQALPNIVPITTLLTKPNTQSVAIIPNEKLLISRCNETVENFILHPAHIMPDGRWYVPSLNVIVNNGNITYALPDVVGVTQPVLYPNFNTMEINGRSYSIKVADSNTNQPVIVSSQTVNSPVVNSPVVNNPVVNSPVVNSQVVNSPVVNRPPRQPINRNKQSLLKTSVNQCEVKSVVSKSSLSVTSDSQNNRTKIFTNKNLKTNSGVDWEDKIPMDVISFIDATDPNADQILHQTSTTEDLNIKLDVVTNFYQKRSKKSRYKEDCDVIDLC